MNRDRERYKLCLQCLEESRNRRPLTIKAIKRDIEKRHKWKNERYSLDSGVRDTALCFTCPYVLEHVVLMEE